MKKGLFNICYLIFAILLFEISYARADFSDVSASHVNYNAIQYVEGEGIVSGYSDGSYKPNNMINRAEFTKIIIESQFDDSDINDCLYKNTELSWDTVFFTDVPIDAWYAKYVCVAKMKGVIGGYPDGTFKPADKINFAEAAKIIVNSFGYTVWTDKTWYKPYVVELGYRNAIPTSITKPDDRLRRGDMAEMIYRLAKTIENLPSNIYSENQPSFLLKSSSDIWQPEQIITWDMQYSSEPDLNTDVKVLDIDLFENDASTVKTLHDKGVKVLCYMNAGAWEDWRSDKDDFPDSVIGNDYEGWEGEKWLDIRQIDKLAPVIRARLDLCKQKGFDGVDPDNVNGYDNSTGFNITANDQLKFNKWLAQEAHERGLAVGLKNDGDQAKDLVHYFEWALTEECYEDDWCNLMKPFTDAGKPVFMTEYTENGTTTKDFCPTAKKLNFNGLLKKLELDEWGETCPDTK